MTPNHNSTKTPRKAISRWSIYPERRASLRGVVIPIGTLVTAVVAFGSLSPATAEDESSGNARLRARSDHQAEIDRRANAQYLEERDRAALNRNHELSALSPTRPSPETASRTTAPPRPPTYSGGIQASAKTPVSEPRDARFAWSSTSPKIDPNDIEAHQRPTLRSPSIGVASIPSSFQETDFVVSQANYQDGFTPPSLPFNPVPNSGGTNANSGLNANPGLGGGSVMPPTMNAPRGNVPGAPLGAGTVPNIANPSNLPQYPKATGSPGYVNGPPFVSGPPCEFDAYTMVSPAAYYAPDPMACPPGSGYYNPNAGWPNQFGEAYVPPTLTPGNVPGYYTGGNVGYRPLFSLGQEYYNVQLGRGIIGQPVAYVQGQPVRNFLRYIFP